MRSLARSRLLASATSLSVLTAMGPAFAPSASGAPSFAVYHGTLGNGKTVVSRWKPCHSITYKVNLAAVPTRSRPRILAETPTAIRVLAARSGFRYRYLGQTREVPRPGSWNGQSAELVIAYTTPAKTRYLAGGPSGVAGPYWAWASHGVSTTRYLDAITGGFVDINTPDMLSNWRPGFGPGVTRGNLLLHKLGHATGLKHVSNRHLLMYPTMTSASPNGYAAGDRAGLAFVVKRPGCVTVR